MNKIQFLENEINRVKGELDSLKNSEINTCPLRVAEIGWQLDQLILEYIEEQKQKVNISKDLKLRLPELGGE